jgi:hypothetical protein
MKHSPVLLLLFFALPLFSQERTLFDDDEIDHGGYGALVVKLTNVNGEFAILTGARGGWIINHTVAIGFGGYGMANNVHSLTTGPLGERFVMFGYGGLDLELILNSDKVVHLSFHSLIGGGTVGFRGGIDDDWFDNDADDSDHHDVFFLAEPGVNLDLNVITWFRISFGASYRYVSGISSPASSNSQFQGPSGMLTLRFGKF